MKRLLSGVQATGTLHLGNYLGAIKNWAQLLNQGYEAFIFIANLHAITVPQDPKNLKQYTLFTAATYIACGLDPSKCNIFVQSTLPEHSELAWILSCFTQLGWLNRMTQFKEKSANKEASLGLYAYPVLQAADILLYQPDLVPVGEDQKQHVELTRDIAQAFNRATNSNLFKIPEPMIMKASARIKSLRDGTKKMSKSDESDYSRINLYDDADTIALKFKKAKSDSIDKIYYDVTNRPEISNLLNIYASLSNTTIQAIETQYANSTVSTFKQDLAEVTISALKPIASEFNKLTANKDYILEVLAEGQEAAHKIAASNLSKIKAIVGLY